MFDEGLHYAKMSVQYTVNLNACKYMYDNFQLKFLDFFSFVLLKT